MSEICARASADLKNRPVCLRNDLPTNFLDGRWVTQGIHKPGINAVFIEGHSLSAAGSTSPIAPAIHPFPPYLSHSQYRAARKQTHL